jgi:hypothetical protein
MRFPSLIPYNVADEFDEVDWQIQKVISFLTKGNLNEIFFQKIIFDRINPVGADLQRAGSHASPG